MSIFKPFYKRTILIVLCSIVIISCKNITKERNKEEISSDTDILSKEYDDFKNILSKEYHSKKFNITVKKILCKEIDNGIYELRIYLSELSESFINDHEFFIYGYPIESEIKDLPEDRVASGFIIWDKKIVYENENENDDDVNFIKIIANSKLNYYETIAFGILDRPNYKRLFIHKQNEVFLN